MYDDINIIIDTLLKHKTNNLRMTLGPYIKLNNAANNTVLKNREKKLFFKL